MGTFPRQYRKIQGVVISQEVGRGKEPSIPSTGHGDENGHGTAQSSHPGLAGPGRDFTEQLLSQSSRIYDPIVRGTDYVGESEVTGRLARAECHIHLIARELGLEVLQFTAQRDTF